MEFRILGPTEIWRDGAELALHGPKLRTVVAALLLARGHLVSDERLSLLLWGWEPPTTMSAQIYTYVSRLRKFLGPEAEISRQRPGYVLHTNGSWFDHAEFQRLTRSGHAHTKEGRFAEAATDFRNALRLWRGRALADVSEHLAEAELPGLEEARLAAIEGRIQADLELGRHTGLVSELTALVAEHPVHERFRQQLMVALYRADRQADAMAVYHDARRLLDEELGVEPGPALARTYHSILVGDLPAAHEPAARPSVHVWANVRPAMLPPDIGDFTGRATELREIDQALRAPAGSDPAAPVLVTGMTGVGKTALAIRAAYACRDAFPDGQLYADLDAGRGAQVAPGTVLGWFLRALVGDTVAIPDSTEERVQLYRSELARRRLLVVLDGAVDDAQLSPLLVTGTESRVVVTSTTFLPSVVGARVVDLDVFRTEDALALLEKVAGCGRVAAEPEEALGLVTLCGHLPLALRVVAARLAARPQMGLRRMVRRLAAEESRLDELRLSDKDVRRSIQHSLPPVAEAEEALRKLALLDVPDFPVWAAAAVLDRTDREAEEILEVLAGAHLLVAAGMDLNGNLHYRFPELVRLFGRERATADERRLVLQQAIRAWSTVVRDAERALLVSVAREEFAAGGREMARAVACVESEKVALSALFRQACAIGMYKQAWSAAEALHDYLLLRLSVGGTAVPAHAPEALV